ncbi:DinB family protein [Chitinophaga nivalis]|uniref:DinB family protein n=1 Tax=Chitinophaga nivalis TaxID=2991709 RepID=A0ABT3ITE8_9BACT|nr:DinB family protein [Chitinophaga nivalis]MCW3463065.1 DinB family protein [Chitinophaga nivalis]MCW3487245.1 DinB family protein [Chitinophaga nivalis]
MLYTTTQTTATDLSELVKDFAAYNLWANRTMINWLTTKPEALLEQEMTSSFPTIKATLRHIWSCQDWWLEVMKKNNPALTYGEVYTGTVQEALEGLLQQSEELVDYLSCLSAEELQEACEVTIPFTGDFNVPRFEMVQHLVTHTTYHRGQIVTMGRMAGITDAPMTDYMYYVLLAR